MRYKQLGNSSLKVSVVGQGTWALGNDFFGEVDVDQGIKAIQAAIDVGINMVDTAPGYGPHFESELAVGKAIQGRRDKVCLATKCGIHRIAGEYVKCLSPKLVRWEMEQSLKRLQTDYIDLYMIHWPDANFGIEGALMGATTPEMAIENAKAGDWELTAAEVKTIDDNYKRIFEL